MRNGQNRTARARQRALLIAAGPDEPDLSELGELLLTAGVAVAGEITQRRSEPDPDRYLGKGKLVELKRAIAEADANLVACDDELLPRQERNLEEALGTPVIDRTAVILDIFADHAKSAEGNLQVELAQLEYNLARMRGLWTHLERLGAGRMDGGIGTRGPGETQIETDRRLARDRISALRRRLEHTKGTRRVMRSERERAGLPTVALAGLHQRRQVDPAERAHRRRGGRARPPLPHAGPHHSLVRDRRPQLPADRHGRLHPQAAPPAGRGLRRHAGGGAGRGPAPARGGRVGRRRTSWPPMLAAVDDVLDEIGAGERPRLLALNKVDLLDGERRRELAFRYPDGDSGVRRDRRGARRPARRRSRRASSPPCGPMELLLPYEEGGRLSELHEVAGEMEREDTADGVVVRARVPAAAAARFERFAVNGARRNGSG